MQGAQLDVPGVAAREKVVDDGSFGVEVDLERDKILGQFAARERPDDAVHLALPDGGRERPPLEAKPLLR